MKRSEYYQEVYKIVLEIPPGKVCTYGQVAYLAGFPQAPRIVGGALSCAPADVPCHRVVNSRGRTAPHFPGQAALLKAEGITFLKNGLVALSLYLWNPFMEPSS